MRNHASYITTHAMVPCNKCDYNQQWHMHAGFDMLEAINT
jgi:hypothetical protein